MQKKQYFIKGTLIIFINVDEKHDQHQTSKVSYTREIRGLFFINKMSYSLELLQEVLVNTSHKEYLWKKCRREHIKEATNRLKINTNTPSYQDLMNHPRAALKLRIDQINTV